MCAEMRKAGKKKAGVWLTELERNMLAEAALALGVSQSDILKQAITDAAHRAKITKGSNNAKQIG